MPRNKIIPYRHDLREKARRLRKNSTLSEILLWKEIRGESLGVQFHRQQPVNSYILDFYCHEIMLAIEIDGRSHDGEEAFQYDEKRQVKLESLGIEFIRFNDLMVKTDILNVMRALEGKVEELLKKKNIDQV